MERILIPLNGDDIAPRFDLVLEAMVILISDSNEILDQRIVVLPHTSAEGLCDVILKERINTVICCGIEDEFYQFLTWKKIKVLDSVIGSSSMILTKYCGPGLSSGEMLL